MTSLGKFIDMMSIDIIFHKINEYTPLQNFTNVNRRSRQIKYKFGDCSLCGVKGVKFVMNNITYDYFSNFYNITKLTLEFPKKYNRIDIDDIMRKHSLGFIKTVSLINYEGSDLSAFRYVNEVIIIGMNCVRNLEPLRYAKKVKFNKCFSPKEYYRKRFYKANYNALMESFRNNTKAARIIINAMQRDDEKTNDFDMTHLRDADVVFIENCKGMKNMDELANVKRVGIRDCDLYFDISCLQNVRDLDIRSSKNLTASKPMPNIRTLHINNNSFVANASIFPNCFK